jgi:ABC-type Fe3+/spermidine/putrescine transport system ATPase subunit
MTNKSMSEAPQLSLRGLRKRFGALEAVRGLDLDVARGEFVALLGPSGCGKSTTLMAIAGFERPDAGTITLDGRDITHEPPERRAMGVVFQDYALFPHMSALENVMYPLRLRGVSREQAEAKARATLAQLRLPDSAANARPGRLSGGQRQRVAVARAIVFDPLILLMDEPLAALDRRLRQHLQFELRHLQASLGTTVLYVTHDQEEALVLADRIAVMREGQIEQLGPPRQLYDEPASAFVAGFLGESNGLAVSLLAERDGYRALAAEAFPGIVLQAPASALSERQGVLVIRPENTRLMMNPPPAGDVQRLPATVTDWAFLGQQIRVELSLAGGIAWTATMHPRQAGLDLAGLVAGTPVHAVWERDDSRLVPL